MDKSPVSGVAGAVRVEKLSLSKLREAERHGKRENESGKSRVVRDAPPVTTTGLDLEALYEAHVKGAFVPKGKNIAIEVLVQFPKDLVDGSDAGYLVTHARRFVESVWGPQSIFGDRCDRDEKGDTNVSVFIAPKYIKKTKRTEKVSVSLTRDLKRLVSEKTNNEEEAHKWAIGRALQDAIFEYFRDEMKLAGVQRGEPKAKIGSDWKTAEQLRKEELQSMKAGLEEEKRKTAELQQNAQQLVEQATADRDQAKALREEAEAAKAAAEAEKQRAAAAREIAERLQQEAEALRTEQKAASRTAEQERIHRNAEIARKEAKLTAELDAATKARRQAEADADAAAENRRASAAVMETTRSELSRVQAERKQLERDRTREAAQLALLARAADDDSGFDLRPSGAGFSMARSRMTQPERAALDSPWSSAMNVIARKLAEALEQVRRALLRLADKETRLERERQEHERSVAAHREAVRTHQNAVRDLDARIATLNEKERQIEERLANASETVSAAESREREAGAAKRLQEQWLTVIAATASAPDKIVIEENGKIAISSQIVASLPEPVRSALGKDAPDWAKNVIKERQALAQAKGQAKAAEAEWRRKSETVSADQRRIEQSRKIAADIVDNKCVASAKGGVLSLHYNDAPGAKAVREHRLAELEPSLVHLANLFDRFRKMTADIANLHTELQDERDSLAKRYPEQAKKLDEEQERTTQKVNNTFTPPPTWGADLGG
jgi:hypothetical protein